MKVFHWNPLASFISAKKYQLVRNQYFNTIVLLLLFIIILVSCKLLHIINNVTWNMLVFVPKVNHHWVFYYGSRSHQKKKLYRIFHQSILWFLIKDKDKIMNNLHNAQKQSLQCVLLFLYIFYFTGGVIHIQCSTGFLQLILFTNKKILTRILYIKELIKILNEMGGRKGEIKL